MTINFKVTGPLQNIRVFDAIVMSFLVLLLMVFAIAVVFMKHSSRIMHTQLQTQSVEKENLNNEWSQLLLEKATWTSGIRVEQIANVQLQMITPTKIEIIKP